MLFQICVIQDSYQIEYHNLIYDDIAHITAVTGAEYKSQFQSPKYIP